MILFHSELMNHRGGKNEESMIKLAKDIGLDVEQMKKDANSVAVQDMLNKGMMVARDIGISGTPAFIVNGVLNRGYLGKSGMNRAIEIARENNKKEG